MSQSLPTSDQVERQIRQQLLNILKNHQENGWTKRSTITHRLSGRWLVRQWEGTLQRLIVDGAVEAKQQLGATQTKTITVYRRVDETASPPPALE